LCFTCLLFNLDLELVLLFNLVNVLVCVLDSAVRDNAGEAPWEWERSRPPAPLSPLSSLVLSLCELFGGDSLFPANAFGLSGSPAMSRRDLLGFAARHGERGSSGALRSWSDLFCIFGYF